MSLKDRTELTFEEAYSAITMFVNKFWGSYRNTLAPMGYEAEDLIQDIAIKMVDLRKNPDYTPDWKPGETIHRKRASGKDYKDVDTSYMLEPDYDPSDPYDWLYNTVRKPEINNLMKYDGRTTSKTYYIEGIVKSTLIDLTRKRDTMKGSVSMDEPDEDGLTLGDRIPSDGDTPEAYVEKEEINAAIRNAIENLDTTPLSDRIVGWSPITGQVDKDGNHVDTHLTARDIGIFIMYDYKPEDIVKFYKDSRTGENVSVSTIKKKWKDAMDTLRTSLLSDKRLQSLGYFN